MDLLALIGWLLLGFLGLGLMLYTVGVFNDLVRLRRTAERDFANVEVLLRQRHDEIPRLVEICRGYLRHERDVLERVTALRGSFQQCGGTLGKVQAENALVAVLALFPAVIESYPTLKANAELQRLARRLSEIESSLADRRELYNQATTHYNTAREQFPQCVLAWTFRFPAGELLALGPRLEIVAEPVRLSQAEA